MDNKVCTNCSNPIREKSTYFRVQGKKKGEGMSFLCPECFTKITEGLVKENQNPNILLALVAGVIGAAVGGIIWYLITVFTGWQIGIIAILVGWLAGRGAILGAGNKRGSSLQILSIIITIFVMLASEYFIFNHFFNEAGFSGSLPIDGFLRVYKDYIFSFEGIITLVFYGIAIWQAFRTLAPRKLVGELITAS